MWMVGQRRFKERAKSIGIVCTSTVELDDMMGVLMMIKSHELYDTVNQVSEYLLYKWPDRKSSPPPVPDLGLGICIANKPFQYGDWDHAECDGF